MDAAQITHEFHARKDDWADKMARFGYAAKGTVYCLVGALTAMTAFGISGGTTAGKQDAFQFLLEQPFGKVLLGLVAAGLLAYVIWRMIEAFKDPLHADSNEAKGFARRAGYFWSALVYGALAFYAASLVMGNGGSSGSGSGSDSGGGRQFIVAKVLSFSFGEWLIGLAAVGTIGYGLYQIYKGFSGSFMKRIKQQEIPADRQRLIERTGRIGFAARGIVLCIIGYLLLRAALDHNAKAAGGTESAFQFMQSTSIPYLMGVVALGLICYGIFQFVRARYETFLR